MATQKLKTHKGTVKRYKLTNPKNKLEAKLMHRRQYRGCMHLQTKKSSSRKSRLRTEAIIENSTQRKRIMKMLQVS